MTQVNDSAATCTLKPMQEVALKADERGNEIVMRTIDISETSLKNAAMNAIGAARNAKKTAMNAMKAAAEAAAKAALKASVSYKK